MIQRVSKAPLEPKLLSGRRNGGANRQEASLQAVQQEGGEVRLTEAHLLTGPQVDR